VDRRATPRRRRRSRLELAWPWVLRVTGLGIIVYETVVERLDRPSLLMVAVALIGLDHVVHIGRPEE
jgi:hypothetical protein